MRYLRNFNESLETKNIEQALIDLTFEENILDRCTINQDGTVDVQGDLVVCDTVQKLPVKFGVVTGHFSARHIPLTTLEGCPDYCQSFDCSSSYIKTLVGGPKHVQNDYECLGTPITDLVGSPEIVRDMNVSRTDLKSLKGAPKQILNNFYCSATYITDLVGGPEEVGNCMEVIVTDLTSLAGAPKSINHLKVSSRDKTLRDPRGLENSVISQISFHNPLEPIKEIWGLFGRKGENSDVVSKRFFDSFDYNYIRGHIGNPHINLFRLKEALAEFDIRPWRFTLPIDQSGRRKVLKYYDLIDEEGRVVNFDGNPI